MPCLVPEEGAKGAEGAKLIHSLQYRRICASLARFLRRSGRSLSVPHVPGHNKICLLRILS